MDGVVEFMSLNLPFFKLHEWQQLIENLATLVYDQEQDLIKVSEVIITQQEMASILSIDDFDSQKILYTLLVYKKIQNQLHRHHNDWFNGGLGEIFKVARMSGKKSTIQGQGELIHQLKESGFIQLSKKIKSLNLKLNYIDETPLDEAIPALVITRFEDIIYDFYHYLGHRVVRCQCCGRMVRLKKGERKSKKYCLPCRRIANNEKALRCYYKT